MVLIVTGAQVGQQGAVLIGEATLMEELLSGLGIAGHGLIKERGGGEGVGQFFKSAS